MRHWKEAGITLILLMVVLGWVAFPMLPIAAGQTPSAEGKTNTTVAKSDDGGSMSAAKKDGPKPKGFFEILFSGGLVGIVIMLALIGLSLLAAYLVFDNILSLRKNDLFPAALADEVHTMLQAARYEQAAAACREQPNMLSFIMQQGFREIENGWSEVEKALEEALAEQAARLYRRVEYLSVIGSLAPMLGLLGTVTGMLMAFQEVALSQGSAGAAELAEGIYQALVTTVVGLIIAIPALGAFALFRNWCDQLVAEGAYMIQHAFGPVKRQRLAAAIATVPPQTVASIPTPPAPPPPPPAREAKR